MYVCMWYFQSKRKLSNVLGVFIIYHVELMRFNSMLHNFVCGCIIPQEKHGLSTSPGMLLCINIEVKMFNFNHTQFFVYVCIYVCDSSGKKHRLSNIFGIFLCIIIYKIEFIVFISKISILCVRQHVITSRKPQAKEQTLSSALNGTSSCPLKRVKWRVWSWV